MALGLWSLPSSHLLFVRSGHPSRRACFGTSEKRNSTSARPGCKASTYRLPESVRGSMSCTARGLANSSCQHIPAKEGFPGLGGSTWHRHLYRGSAKHNRRAISRKSSLQEEVLLPLGLDFLTFLAATVIVIPVFKSVKASPVLGFLFSGLILGQLGLFRNREELEKLSELGVLFLLFEMGLELSLDRLKALAKYAFGLGTLTMGLTTAAFTLFALPVGHGVGTQILVKVFHASPKLAAIRTVDEAIVIGAALSLSSSAFVLQIMAEKGELATKFGSATLGILLLQDIAIVPFLVLLPVVESPEMDGSMSTMALLTSLGPTALKTLGGLGLLLLGGRFVLRRIFEIVARARSDETFVALCLLTVTGASLCTQRLGFSDTLGAFCAGVLLAETNYRTQVEADIRPFRGMLLGLFFVTTGASLDVQLLLQNWTIVLALLGGLLAVKVGIIGGASQLFGLTKGESIRTGFMLAQGGEFAFVLLSLAKELKVLPDELNRLLIIVVVLSMALTPLLAEVGERMASSANEFDDEKPQVAFKKQFWFATTAAKKVRTPIAEAADSREGAPALARTDPNPIVICGFGQLGQTVANMIESPLAVSLESRQMPYIAFDHRADRCNSARAAGFNVTYGNGSAGVLHAAGIQNPRALVLAYTGRAKIRTATHELREHYPEIPIYARALDAAHAAELKAAGATDVFDATVEAGAAIGSGLLTRFGAKQNSLQLLITSLRKQVDRTASAQAEEIRAHPASPHNQKSVFKFDPAKSSLEDVSSSYLQKTVSIAESTEDVNPESEVEGPSARDKVLAGVPTRLNNGVSDNGSSSGTESTSSSTDEGEQRHLPSFESHRQRRDSDKGQQKDPAFQSMDLQGDSES